MSELTARVMVIENENQIAVSGGACRDALSRVLASDHFERADRLSSFLSYIVEETLAGRGELIRGKTIAMDVYGRDPTSSGKSENVVRVDAHRLRRSLKEYYTAEGKDDPVQIWVDSGGYVPRVEKRRDEPSNKPVDWPGKTLTGAMVVMLAAGLAVAIYIGISSSQPRPEHDPQSILERQALRDKSPATLQAANLAEQARGFLFPILEPERQRIALNIFRNAIRIDPDYFGGYAGAAQSLTTLSKLMPPGQEKDETGAEALRMADFSIRLNPTHSWTQSAAGWAAFGNREFERAFELSSRAADISPEDGYILDFHGVISMLTGHFEEARRASDPSHTRKSAKQHLANLNIFGAANIHLGKYEEAIASFHRAAELGDPISALSLVYLASANQALGKFVLASGYVQELATTWPDFRPEVALP
ncbi:MAG: tetratricopeptide repeat protein, partial [Paracoccaceae bacterium]